MTQRHHLFAFLPHAAVMLCGICLAGCSTVNSATERMANMITPYKVEIVQGNFISREQVQALKPGMSRLQVQEILGTPLVASIFHAERWDYVFTMKRTDVPVQSRKLSVFFKDDLLERYESDEMPGEQEFVGMIDTHSGKQRKVPLQASEEDLAKYASQSAANAPQQETPGEQTPPSSSSKLYPPLE